MDAATPTTTGVYNTAAITKNTIAQNGSYGKGPNPYFAKMKAWREDGKLEGLTIG